MFPSNFPEIAFEIFNSFVIEEKKLLFVVILMVNSMMSSIFSSSMDILLMRIPTCSTEISSIEALSQLKLLFAF